MAVIYLANNKGECIVSDNDYETLSLHKWRLSSCGAAITNVKKKTVLMHRMICKTNLFVDHINGNRLDNRKENLRPATAQQNQFNKKPGKKSKTGLKGIGFCKQTKKWKVTIFHDKKRKTLGRFSLICDALKCYHNFTKQYHGDFAYSNRGVP